VQFIAVTFFRMMYILGKHLAGTTRDNHDHNSKNTDISLKFFRVPIAPVLSSEGSDIGYIFCLL